MTGILKFENNKWQITFFNEKKGKNSVLFCQETNFSQGFALNKAEETEVEFERDNTPQQNPIKIRKKGEDFQGTHQSNQVDYNRGRQQPPADLRNPQNIGKNNFVDSEPPIDSTYTPQFHNPYNFVPAPLRDIENLELGDGKPIGHDKFYDDYFSGKLTVKMKIETPLIVLNTAKMLVDGNDHKKFPVRLENGKPFINPTAIRGMLRSAYEAVTNSRFGVFDKNHSDRLAFRGEARSPIAARIELIQDKLYIREFSKTAVLVRYRKHYHNEIDKAKSVRALRYSDRSFPEHGDAVLVRTTERRDRRNNRFLGFKVAEIKKMQIGQPTPNGFEKGWVCITNANTENKVYERVFIENNNDKKTLVGSNHKKMWNDLITNYQTIHELEIKKRRNLNHQPSDYLGNEVGKTAFSRQIYSKTDLNLDKNTLCYVKYENDQIKSIFPVMISRQLFDTSTETLLNECLKSATEINKLSPADRVFGWVNQNGQGSYRGQLRVGSVKCLSDNPIHYFDNELPLNILGQPKPQQGRFYVAENQNGDAQTHQRNKENAGYKIQHNGVGRALRGRKVYPHHSSLPSDYWTIQTGLREYERPNKLQDNQNRSIQGWIKPKTEFQFDIHFTNLSKVELGALILLLKLPEKHFHRFGGGKPLGFGSVRLDIVEEEITSGKDLQTFYLSLDSNLTNSTTSADCKIEFETIANKNILEAFKIACNGFNDNLLIHYPRLNPQPHPDGKSFEWFVANNKNSRDNNGRKMSLPNLKDKRGLPRNPTN